MSSVAAWFLMMSINWSGGAGFRAFEFASKGDCHEALAAMRIDNAVSGDNQHLVVAFCSPRKLIPRNRLWSEGE